MLVRLGPDGMSSDESDDELGATVYTTRKLPWRAPRVTLWLRAMDAFYLANLANDIGRLQRGKTPHYRINSTQSSKLGRPVEGLPRNFYDAQWLSQLHPSKRRKIKVDDTIYDMKHSDEVLQ